MLKRLLPLLALLLLPAPASAWWEYGHESVASVAALEVKPATRAAIRRLIAHSRELETPTCPIRTIEDASYWPDCVKPLGDRFSYAFSWHYQNADICKPFDLTAACKDGNCVSAQIERNARLLADRKLPARERLMAFAFLVHFVGDLHQPLHGGDKSDRGGNDFRMNYGVIPSNIHAIWDGYLADRGISTPPPDAAGILSGLTPAERAEMRGGTVQDWSRESWAAAREFGYGAVMEDPCGPLPETRPVMDEATTRNLIPILRRQVARGGIRLARLLDEALG
jgi:nuclease S1